MLDEIAEGIVKFIIQLIIEVFCFYTGEIILFILSFGHKKPRWDYYSDVTLPKWIILTEISFWIGVLFWVLIAIWIISLI
jgi:hypothetical protein